MLKIKNYVKVNSLEEAYELNQKKTAKILGGMVWMKMGNRNLATAIDLSGLGLDQITENDKIFFVDQNSDNINYLIFRYEVTPVHINENSDSYSLGEGKYDENGKLIEDSWKNVYTMQDWEDELRTEGYTYVYLYSVTPAFENDYKELFQSKIKEKTLYQISEDGDSVILKKV